MTFALSVFGFNQPFFFTLIGIILVLLLTLALVGSDQSSDDENDTIFCGNDDRPEVTIGGILSRRSTGLLNRRHPSNEQLLDKRSSTWKKSTNEVIDC
ncbi:hypothetical protein niasHT_006226 [Heterodera trifolii]|uniref:Uncharacterized protein n=1 Tax=Heterodera trifolii TaxID=157864 RepID=A0ABD2M281_9BILA